jgi:hypothetical protein
MDPRERADAALARARARSAYVVTPDDAISPMDATSTVQIPRAMITAADQPESTLVIPNDVITAGINLAAIQAEIAGTARGQVPHPFQHQPEPPYPPPYPGQPYPPYQEPPYPAPPYPDDYPPDVPDAQPQPAAPRQLDGLVPTVQQPVPQRSLLSRRLDGN